jgi:hypothetical protein
LITQDDVSVVPVKIFVEFAKNPNGSNKCALKMSEDTIVPLVCVYVHIPVSGPDKGGYDNAYVNPFGEAAVRSAPIVC